jgi:predicted nucleic acid-binding protein
LKVLVDTSVWSLMLRRDPANLNGVEKKIVRELQDIVNDGRAQIIGPIRQELLSGIKSDRQYAALRQKLAVFDDTELTTRDYEGAATAANFCSTAGVPTSSIDVLICAVALDRQWPILTTDKGFVQFQKVLKFQFLGNPTD